MRVLTLLLQIYGSVSITPFAMKALWGSLSDSLPLLGYHKRTYIVAVSGGRFDLPCAERCHAVQLWHGWHGWHGLSLLPQLLP